MKTKIRTFAGIVVLGFIGFININAAFVNNHTTVASKKLNNFNLVMEQEEILTIDSWMLENELWTSKSEIETMEAEKSMTIDLWMLENELWTSKSEIETMESEKSLTIDSWMLENELWAPKSEIETMGVEASLEVETWMTNQEVFFKSEPSAAICARENMGR